MSAAGLVSTDRALHDEVTQLLARLPGDADQIATVLAAADPPLRGLPGSALGHPLARWLTCMLAAQRWAWLTGVGLVHVISPTATALVPLPLHAARFGRLFDEGWWPGLQLQLNTPPVGEAAGELVDDPGFRDPGTACLPAASTPLLAPVVGRAAAPDDTAVLTPVRDDQEEVDQ